MPQHKANFDIIGHVPKHRAGGPKPRHRLIALAAKPAAAFDEVNNNPLTKQAVVRQNAVKAVGAVGKVGGLLMLAKAASGHDAFRVS